MNYCERDIKVALAGNPNVGKSTVFNALTGLNQHTGNWAGKTVEIACGGYRLNGREYSVTDLPGTYSLFASSREEEVARDYICFEDADCIVVVCDATCLERNLNLVLQISEISDNVVLCLNLIDEAKKKNIHIDANKLQKLLNIPVVTAAARSGKGIAALKTAIEKQALSARKADSCKLPAVKYISALEKAINTVSAVIDDDFPDCGKTRWAALRLLEGEYALAENIGVQITENIANSLKEAHGFLCGQGIDKRNITDKIVACIVLTAEGICAECVCEHVCEYYRRDGKIDRLLTGKLTGIPLMFLMFLGIFWLTINGANYPSAMLSEFFGWIGVHLRNFMVSVSSPEWLTGMVCDGIYSVLTWVVSVMLPPMAIFFPLFTILEDFGYLPRIAFNLDRFFMKANACGKQALTMAMGFGCNACGVSGARIIDSPRERLIAIITNVFVPCNGRFPTLIAVISMFFITSGASGSSLVSSLMLTCVIAFGVMMTLIISRILSKTVLKGVPSSFTLELPPFRRPQFAKVLVRSLLDRTLFVLGRAVVVAAPAGLIIWIFANCDINGVSVLTHCSDFLDPFGKFIGLDGVIILAFILGFPANEIVLPIAMMGYMQTTALAETDNLAQLRELFVANGWTECTALCMLMFSLLHFPCSTTCITIWKETKSVKWTLLSMGIPTACGIIVCALIRVVFDIL